MSAAAVLCLVCAIALRQLRRSAFDDLVAPHVVENKLQADARDAEPASTPELTRETSATREMTRPKMPEAPAAPLSKALDTAFFDKQIAAVVHKDWDRSPSNPGWRSFVDARLQEIVKTNAKIEPFTAKCRDVIQGIKTLRVSAKLNTERQYDGIPANGTYQVEYYITLEPWRIRQEIRNDGISIIQITADGRRLVTTTQAGQTKRSVREATKYCPSVHFGIPLLQALQCWKEFGAGYSDANSSNMVRQGLVFSDTLVGQADIVAGDEKKNPPQIAVRSFVYYGKFCGMDEILVDNVVEHQIVQYDDKKLLFPLTVTQHVLRDGQDFDPERDIAGRLQISRVRVNTELDASMFATAQEAILGAP